MKTESISITSEQGVLDLRGGKYDSALLLDGELIQFTFLREIGSTWRYQIAKSLNMDLILEDKEYRTLVRNGVLSDVPLSRQFQYLIQFLAKGRYHLRMRYLDADIAVQEMATEVHGLPTDFEGYFDRDTYGGMKDVIETQGVFKEEVILQYENLIAEGVEPIVVLLQSKDSENNFIIDGHHKIAAYCRLCVSTKCLQITKLDVAKIPKSEGLDFIRASSGNTEFEKRYLKND